MSQEPSTPVFYEVTVYMPNISIRFKMPLERLSSFSAYILDVAQLSRLEFNEFKESEKVEPQSTL
jgi:hypothetical protein